MRDSDVVRGLPMPRNQKLHEAIDFELARGEDWYGIERRLRHSILCYVIHKADFNLSEAARILKIHRNNVVRWAKEMVDDGEKDKQDKQNQQARQDSPRGGSGGESTPTKISSDPRKVWWEV